VLLGELHNGMEVDQGAVGFVHDRSSRDHAGKALATAHPLRVYNSEHLRRAVEQWRFKEWELIHIQPIFTQADLDVSTPRLHVDVSDVYNIYYMCTELMDASLWPTRRYFSMAILTCTSWIT
jgi:hypothetical protein